MLLLLRVECIITCILAKSSTVVRRLNVRVTVTIVKISPIHSWTSGVISIATQALQGRDQMTEKRSHLHTNMSLRTIPVRVPCTSGALISVEFCAACL